MNRAQTLTLKKTLHAVGIHCFPTNQMGGLWVARCYGKKARLVATVDQAVTMLVNEMNFKPEVRAEIEALS